MTDNSDRQDGDELHELADEIEMGNGLILMTVLGTTKQLGIKRTTQIIAALRSVPPTRDGAEGAGLHRGSVKAMAYAPAPPKPAPDAVRVCATPPQDLLRLAEAIEQARNAYLDAISRGPCGEVEKRALEELLWNDKGTFGPALRLAALAAPVPSPDGAGVVVDQILHQFENDDRTMYPDYEVILAIEKIQSALLSSPAVAAEPVVRDTNMFSRLAHEPLAVIPEGCSTPLDIRTAAEIEFDRKAAKVASSTIRGDREAEIEIVADAIDLARFQHPEHPRARLRSFAEADRSDREYAIRLAKAAILSLHVQPGAGERDSDAAEADRYFNLAGEFGNQLQTLAGAVQDAVDILAERKRGNDARSPSHNARVILETALKSVSPSALPSRQAPHSSSEGGR